MKQDIHDGWLKCQQKTDKPSLEMGTSEQYSKDTRDGPYSWFILFIIFMIKFVTMGTFVTYGLLFAETLKQTTLNREEVSWQFASITTVENFSSLFVSILTLYLSWRKMEFIGGLLGVVSNLGAFFSESRILNIILIGVVEGLSQAFTIVPIMAINNAYFKKYRSTAYGLLASGPYFGALLLQYLVSNAMRSYGLKYGYLVLAAANCLNLILALFITKPDESAHHDDEPGGSHELPKDMKISDAFKIFGYLLRRPYFHLIWLTQLIFYWHYASMSLLIVDYGLDRGLDKNQAESLLTVYSIGALVGRFAPAFLLDLRFMHVRYMAGLACCTTGITLMLMTLTPPGLYWIYMIFVTLIGLFISFIYVMINMLNVEYIGVKMISMSFGLSAFIDGWIMLARPKIIGYFRDELGDYNIMYTFMYTVCLVVGLGWLLAPMIGRAVSKMLSHNKGSTTDDESVDHDDYKNY